MVRRNISAHATGHAVTDPESEFLSAASAPLRSPGLRRERVCAGEQNLHGHQSGGPGVRHHIRLRQGGR